MAAIQEKVTHTWRELDGGMKTAAIGAGVLAIVAIVWGIYALTRDEYATLFSDLSSGDAAAMVEALKKQKTPYRLTNAGTTIEVPAERVHETRLSIMSGNVPLSGGVGFEIFDKQGLGATEQSQRVSFQRALQGELARSIASLENVKQARVHLVLPESTLFKRDRQEATAAVTITTKSGSALDRQQIIGIQRLIAASVAGLDPSRVVVTDQRGIVLSAADPGHSSSGSVEARLEVQRQVETHIAAKIAHMLDTALGPGQAIVSVTAAISFDAIKTTTQDLLPLRGTGEQAVTRKRQIQSGAGNEATVEGTMPATTERRTSSTLEVDYEYGRRVEEVIAAPGAVRRLTVGVIVPSRFGDDQQRRIAEIVQVAAGIDAARGDVVSVQPLAGMIASGHDATSSESNGEGGEAQQVAEAQGLATPAGRSLQIFVIAGVIALLVVVLLAYAAARRKRSLSEFEREQLLQEIRITLGDDARTASAKQ